MNVYPLNEVVTDQSAIWEPCSASIRDVVTPSTSTTVITGGFYRNVSDGGLDTQQPEVLDDNSNLRASLHQLNSMRPSKQFVSNVSRMIGEMKTVVTTYLDGNANLVPYGSIASNLILDNSCVDILVFISSEVFAPQFEGGKTRTHHKVPLGLVKEYEVRQSMKKALLKIGELFTVFCGLLLVKVTSPVPLQSVTPSSRVPVLAMVDPISNVRFEIVCNHVLSLSSTRLVKAYNSLSPTGKFRDFVLLVKRWATQRNLVGGALSGFAWTLMCIYYCQTALGLFPILQGLYLGTRQQWTDRFGSNRRCDVGFEDGS